MKKVHSKGIIHRDLKLENILLDANNRAKLSDFGLCTFIKDDDETMSHTSMAGSLKYMSPELLQERTDYDEKVDVYAFGVVFSLSLLKANILKSALLMLVMVNKRQFQAESPNFQVNLSAIACYLSLRIVHHLLKFVID